MNPIFEKVKQDTLNKQRCARIVARRMVEDFEYRLTELLKKEDASKFQDLSYSKMGGISVGVHFSLMESCKDLREYSDRQYLKEMFPQKIREHFHNHPDNTMKIWDAWATVDTFCESVEVRFYSNTPPQFLLAGADAFFEAEKKKKQQQEEERNLKASILAEEVFKTIPNLINSAGIWDVDYSSTQEAFTFRAIIFSPPSLVLLSSIKDNKYDLKYSVGEKINNLLHDLTNRYNTKPIKLDLENDATKWKITIPEETLTLIYQTLTEKP